MRGLARKTGLRVDLGVHIRYVSSGDELKLLLAVGEDSGPSNYDSDEERKLQAIQANHIRIALPGKL